MTISAQDWTRFTDRLAAVSNRAALELRRWVNAQGGLLNIERQRLIDYAFALATKYGEGTSALAAAWYDTVAEAAGRFLPAAEPAATATYAETAKAVNGVLKISQNEELLAGAVERLVKMPGVDTTLRNAIRDGAECAWIPHGDTCAFCIALASRGWRRASRNMVQNGHAEHIHAHCDCTYQVRFDGRGDVEGYDPERYKMMYKFELDDNGNPRVDEHGEYVPRRGSSTSKINGMRRDFYSASKASAERQGLSDEAKRIELNSSAAEEADV